MRKKSERVIEKVDENSLIMKKVRLVKTGYNRAIIIPKSVINSWGIKDEDVIIDKVIILRKEE